MKPILIVQHLERGDVPLLIEKLKPRDIQSHTVRPDRGESLPSVADLSQFSGLCFCGGTQSANDSCEWIGRELALIRAAADIEMPVIGHCLGGQLISKALGGNVTVHHAEEYGWQRLIPSDNKLTADWLGMDRAEWFAMQWHQDTFTVPHGATQILSGEHCHPQAFVWNNMLAMQFHVELVEESVRHWAIDLAEDAPPPSPMVQTPQQVLSDMKRHMPISLELGARLYASWLDRLT